MRVVNLKGIRLLSKMFWEGLAWTYILCWNCSRGNASKSKEYKLNISKHQYLLQLKKNRLEIHCACSIHVLVFNSRSQSNQVVWTNFSTLTPTLTLTLILTSTLALARCELELNQQTSKKYQQQSPKCCWKAERNKQVNIRFSAAKP